MRTCTHGPKRRYDTEKEADRALKAARRFRKPWARKRLSPVEQRWYFCQNCGGFHLTSQGYDP